MMENKKDEDDKADKDTEKKTDVNNDDVVGDYPPIHSNTSRRGGPVFN